MTLLFPSMESYTGNRQIIVGQILSIVRFQAEILGPHFFPRMRSPS